MDEGLSSRVYSISDEEAWIRFENATDEQRNSVAKHGCFGSSELAFVSPEVMQQFRGYMRCRNTYLRALRAQRLPARQVDDFGRDMGERA